jgi:hypothetical protein
VSAHINVPLAAIVHAAPAALSRITMLSVGGSPSSVNVCPLPPVNRIVRPASVAAVLPVAETSRAGAPFHPTSSAVSFAVQPPPLARPAWQILGVLIAGLDDADTAPATAADAFLRLGDHHAEYSGLSYDIIGSRGALMNDTVRLPVGAGGR